MVATCAGAGSEVLEGASFGMVLLDEGSQCCEPEALIPLVLGAHHAVLVGDQCQLPPVVRSTAAADGAGPAGAQLASAWGFRLGSGEPWFRGGV